MILSSLCALLTAGSSSITFEGGDDQVVAQWLANATSRSVAVVADPDRRWPKRSFEFEDQDELKTKLLLFVSGVEMPPSGIAASTQTYPLLVFLNQNRSTLLRKYASAKVTHVHSGGLLTVNTIKGPASLSAVLNADLGKPVEWHWFFEDIFLNVVAHDVSERQYLTLIAKTIGARLTEDDKRFYLDLDLKELRKRGIATLTEAAANEPRRGGLKASYMFDAEVLKAATDAMIARAYENPPGPQEDELTLNSEAVKKWAYEKLKNRFPIEDDGVRRSLADLELWKRIGPLLDLTKQPKVIFSSSGVSGAVFFGTMDGKPFRFVL